MFQGCTRGTFDYRGPAFGDMKIHDVEEQSRLPAKIPLDQTFRTTRARRDLTRCGCFIALASKRLVAAEIRAFCLPAGSRGSLVIDGCAEGLAEPTSTVGPN